MKIHPVEFELLHAGGRTDKHDEANANAPNKPQATVTAVMQSVSFVATLSKAMATEYAGGYDLSARAERVYALLWDYSQCFSFYTSLYHVFTLLGCDVAQIGIHRRFATTERSRLLGSSSDGW